MIENNIKNLRRQKIMTVALLTIPACASVLSCGPKGPEGPTGPAGTSGPAGATGATGATGAGGSGSSLPACLDIINNGICYSTGSNDDNYYNISILCTASGSLGAQAFKICYYTDDSCVTYGSTYGIGMNYTSDIAGGTINLINNTVPPGPLIGGVSASIVSVGTDCSPDFLAS